MATETPQDREHIKALAVAHYVYGGLIALFAIFGILLAFFPLLLTSLPRTPGQDVPPEGFAALFGIIGSIIAILFLAFGGLTFWAGHAMQQRRHWLFCMVVSGFNCLSFPLGTTLGVLTMIVLLRPTVKAAFGAAPPPIPPAAAPVPPPI